MKNPSLLRALLCKALPVILAAALYKPAYANWSYIPAKQVSYGNFAVAQTKTASPANPTATLVVQYLCEMHGQSHLVLQYAPQRAFRSARVNVKVDGKTVPVKFAASTNGSVISAVLSNRAIKLLKSSKLAIFRIDEARYRVSLRGSAAAINQARGECGLADTGTASAIRVELPGSIPSRQKPAIQDVFDGRLNANNQHLYAGMAAEYLKSCRLAVSSEKIRSVRGFTLNAYPGGLITGDLRAANSLIAGGLTARATGCGAFANSFIEALAAALAKRPRAGSGSAFMTSCTSSGRSSAKCSCIATSIATMDPNVHAKRYTRGYTQALIKRNPIIGFAISACEWSS